MALQKWEYLNYLGSGAQGPVQEVETRAGGVLYRTEDVDELGEQGWELIGVDNSGHRPHYYFRRPKQSPAAEAAAVDSSVSSSDPDPSESSTYAESDPAPSLPPADQHGWRTAGARSELAAWE